MAEEWRLSIDFTGHPGTGRRFSGDRQARELLRGRFGDDITMSAEKKRIFLYTERADAATEAELVARQVLAEQGLSADIRLDRWDPSGQAWRDARSAAPEQDAAPPAADAGSPGPMSSPTADAIGTVISGGLDILGMIP